MGDLVQRFGVVADAAAGATEGEGWTHDDRIADLVGVLQRADNVGDDFGGDGWLADGVHRVFEHLAVFGFVDGFRICAEELDIMTSENPSLASCMERVSPVWPPRVERMASGRSFLMTRLTVSRVSGSM